MTVKLIVVESKPVNLIGGEETIVLHPSNDLFGSWIECGNEEEDLKEIYEKRKK